jgi:hypothetical protein
MPSGSCLSRRMDSSLSQPAGAIVWVEMQVETGTLFAFLATQRRRSISMRSLRLQQRFANREQLIWLERLDGQR